MFSLFIVKLARNFVDSSSAGSGAVAAAGQQALRVREVLAGVQAQEDAPPPHELPRREVQVSHVWQIFTEQLLSHLVRQTPQAARQLQADTAPTAQRQNYNIQYLQSKFEKPPPNNKAH